MKWIKCSERMPENMIPVLVTNKNGEMFVAEWEVEYENWHLPAAGYYPTHWMPLPEKPLEPRGIREA